MSANKIDIDATLYEARQIRAGMSILKIEPNTLSSFGYLELQQFAWLVCDRLDKFIKDIDGIIEDIIASGAKDYETPA